MQNIRCFTATTFVSFSVGCRSVVDYCQAGKKKKETVPLMATCPADPDSDSDVCCSKKFSESISLGATVSIATSVVDALKVHLTWGLSSVGHSTAVDLDLIAFVLDAKGNGVDVVSYCNSSYPAVDSAEGKKNSRPAVTLQSGDQRVGTVGEAVALSLSRLHQLTSGSDAVHTIAFVASCPNTKVSIEDIGSLSITLSGALREGSEQRAPTFIFNVPQCSERSPSADTRHMMLIAALQLCPTARLEWTLSTYRSCLRGATFAEAVPQICRAVGLPQNGLVKFRFPLTLEKGECFPVSECMADRTLRVGAGWDLPETFDDKDSPADIDLTCVALDRSGVVLDYVYWGKLAALSGALQHSGDNETGEGDGLDEYVMVHLDKLPADASALVFAVSCYSDGHLDALRNIFFCLQHVATEADLCRFEHIGALGTYTSFIPCVLEKVAYCGAPAYPSWQLRITSLPAPGKSIGDGVLRAAMISAATSREVSQALSINLRQASLRGKMVTPRKQVNHNTPAQSSAEAKSLLSWCPADDVLRLKQQRHTIAAVFMAAVVAMCGVLTFWFSRL